MTAIREFTTVLDWATLEIILDCLIWTAGVFAGVTLSTLQFSVRSSNGREGARQAKSA
jgi:hypothetical protein